LGLGFGVFFLTDDFEISEFNTIVSKKKIGKKTSHSIFPRLLRTSFQKKKSFKFKDE